MNISNNEFGWRQAVLDEMEPGLAGFYVVDDPDHLMVEPGIQKVLDERGFEFYVFDDSIALRYFYESKVRNNMHANNRPLVISVDAELIHIRELPFDIINQARVVNLSLTDCFPSLYADVLRSLEPEELDTLQDAVLEYTPGQLGDIASRDFVLRHVYQVAPEVIQSASDLLRTFLRLHYRDIDLPELLKQRLSELLCRRQQFANWPIKRIVSSRQSFFSFLQEHWPAYVNAVSESLDHGVKEPAPVYHYSPEDEQKVILPFGHDDVRVYIDNLFLEGHMSPIEVEHLGRLNEHWCMVGIQVDAEKDSIRRIYGLIKLCSESLPAIGARHQEWFLFAARWAELCAACYTDTKETGRAQFIELQGLVDSHFTKWMLENYHGLHNHPPVPPTMLHHIPRSMAREIDVDDCGKSAVILMDGLALDQWVTLRNNLGEVAIKCESSVFAWVPTVTSVSRQSLFAGKAPYQFSKSIGTTSYEPKAWQNYWIERGLNSAEIFYEKSLGTDDVHTLIDRLSDHRLRAVGLVINTVDDMMHGMQLGSPGMHNQVALWAKSGYLAKLIHALVQSGFSVHLTSDHGNVEAHGCGQIREGAIAESRGERTRVYASDTLRADWYRSIGDATESAVEWPQIGLPSDYWPIVMSGRDAFVANNKSIVGHGGISIEEVIVPYIRFSETKDE